ncbi:MAG: PD40 domain-containing protein, partial [Spirochaetes bacterium]|nr:PD40 domain-containing protein [Spirochaetota bacterium]
MRRQAIGPAILLALLAAAPARSESGANAASARWEQAETEHFLFVFEPRDRAAADELATFCEEVYAEVTGFFGSYPEKVPCVIHGGLDYANGGTSPFPARIDLVVTAPSDHSMGARSESWLRILLTHELTHFVHLTMDRGPFFALSRVLGRDAAMASGLFLPGWMVEGPTTNLETIFSAGGRGRSPLFEIFSKAPIVEGDLFSLRQAGYDSAFPPHGRIYVAGSILVEHILSTYGEDSFTRIMDAYLAFPIFGPWAAIEKVTGRKASELYEDMRARLAERHLASARVAGGALLTPDSIGDYWRPQPTSAGLYVYRSTPQRPPAIVRDDPVSDGETVLLAVALTDESSFCSTADGGTIYFTTLDYDWRSPGAGEAVSDLYCLQTGTGRVRRITRGAHLWQPAVSPDGRHLAAVQGTGSYSRLVEVDVQTGSVQEVFSRAESNVYNPSFSPDGERLAFTFNLRGFQDMAVAPFAAGAPGDAVLLTGPDPAGEYYPSFLADGRLLYCSDRTGSLCLYLADLATGESSLAVEDPVAAISGIDDAGTLIYSSYSSKGFCLKTMPIAELRPGQAAAAPLPARSPQSYPPAPEWTGRAIPSRPYHDFPLPYLWYPWLPIGFPSPGSIDVGIGAAALGGSLLGISSWSLGVAWHPLTGQPAVALAVASALGNLRINGRLSLDYMYADSYRQDFASSLTVSLPLVSRNTLGRGFSLVARTGLLF